MKQSSFTSDYWNLLGKRKIFEKNFRFTQNYQLQIIILEILKEQATMKSERHKA